MRHIPRFYVDTLLDVGSVVTLSAAQMHHAFSVLRISDGDVVHIFNEKFGEWQAHVSNRKKGFVICDNILIKPKIEKGPCLACCIINPNRFSMILEKATELGVIEIIPIISQFSQYRTLNRDKCMQTIISAVEQSCRLSIPNLGNVVPLSAFIENFPQNRTLLVGDTSGNPKQLRDIISENCTFLVGPEGGFSEEERQIFSRHNFIKNFRFGNNILRSETATTAFLSSWVEKYA